MGSIVFNPAKKQKQEIKIKNTTSQKYAFRISGIQVYDSTSDETVFRNKYWGRKVLIEQIENALALYFHNGKEQTLILS